MSRLVDVLPPWRSPRWIVLGFLMTSFGWAPMMAMSSTAPPTAPLAVAYGAGLILYGFALLTVLRNAVEPAPVLAAGIQKTTLLIIVCSALWTPTHLWTESGETPWVWLAGFAIAACALLTWHCGVIAAVILGGAAALGGEIFDGSPIPSLLTTLGCALAAWATCHVLVWIHRLWLAAQDGREAHTELAAAQERLRVGRELHDVLGQRLTVIALKAELAADLARQDPDRAAAESESIRELANGTLHEARRAIHGESAIDLPTQLRSARLVLDSAGIDTTIDVEKPDLIPPPITNLLAMAVREAVTNLLRHSDARTASILISATTSMVTMRIVNDGARGKTSQTSTGGGTGLAALSARCAVMGASLVAGPIGENRFELSLASPRDSGKAP
ncbi:sensor histidine kinase [Gordonia jacobaea]|uniref:sensor histidine kinase n=1 Tax=Gordonia jacobaea TaxID=122202 RepID=UPI003D70C73F